jgi:phytanoyl-CoA hydroxylase
VDDDKRRKRTEFPKETTLNMTADRGVSEVKENAPTAAAGDLFSADEREKFARDGYIIVRQLAEKSILNRMLEVTRDGLAREIAPLEYEAELRYPGAPVSLDAEGGRTVRRLKQAVSRDFCFTEWVTSPSLAGRLQQLLGPELVLPLAHHNCIMTKQPRHSSDTGWHQDIRYWSFERPDLVSVWLALTPENVHNGCLYVIPGTHRMKLDPRRYDEDSFLRPGLPENKALIEKAVRAELEPGDGLFFHALTFHAASRNHSEATKMSVVFTFRPADNRPLPGSRSASLPELLLPASLGHSQS